MSGITWEYTSIVIATELWPNASDTILGFSPERKSSVANVWRHLWNGSDGSPTCGTKLVGCLKHRATDSALF